MKTIMIKNFSTWIFLVFIVLLSAGCSNHAQYRSSSVVNYLYPDKQDIQQPQIPLLNLPLKVGIAFVPEESSSDDGLIEETKINLLESISSNFKQYPFVASIQTIPSAYLYKEGGFSNLNQLLTMYGIDVIALVSYDQQQFTNEGVLSLAYWTLIGAYIVPGNKNDTHTMLDVAIFDIKSQKMLFRAPGLSHINGRSTPINVSEELREDSITGFKEASKQLIVNLDQELKRFRERVKESPTEYTVNHRSGYTGGGSVDIWLLLSLLSFLFYGVWAKRLEKH